MNECIWLNEKIVVNSSPLYCISSIRRGILQISDLFTPSGNLLSHTEINEKHNSSMTFLDLLRIRMMIPHEWKEILLKEIRDEIRDEIRNDIIDETKGR
jgi:hypothetical protein